MVIEGNDRVVAFPQWCMVNYVRNLMLFICKDEVNKGRIVISSSTSWFLNVLKEKTVSNSLDELGFLAVFSMWSCPRIPIDIPVIEIANQTNVTVGFGA